ncbi:hypothetical protein D3C72_1283100 [compost metagenome]
MPIPTFTGLPPDPSFEDMKDKLNTVVKELQNLLLNLDTLNVTRLNAEVIEANTITADKMNVNELSAITANLGHIVSGLVESVEIYGSYIATNRGAYPRAEMSVNQNMFATYQSDSSFIQIKAVNAGSNSPQLTVASPSASLNLYQQGSASYIFTTGIDLRVTSSGDITLMPSNPGNVYIPFTQLRDFNTSTTLSQQLSAKATQGISTSLSGGHNHGIPAGAQFMAVDGTVYTWYPADNHSHAQN